MVFKKQSFTKDKQAIVDVNNETEVYVYSKNVLEVKTRVYKDL